MLIRHPLGYLLTCLLLAATCFCGCGKIGVDGREDDASHSVQLVVSLASIEPTKAALSAIDESPLGSWSLLLFDHSSGELIAERSSISTASTSLTVDGARVHDAVLYAFAGSLLGARRASESALLDGVYISLSDIESTGKVPLLARVSGDMSASPSVSVVFQRACSKVHLESFTMSMDGGTGMSRGYDRVRIESLYLVNVVGEMTLREYLERSFPYDLTSTVPWFHHGNYLYGDDTWYDGLYTESDGSSLTGQSISGAPFWEGDCGPFSMSDIAGSESVYYCLPNYLVTSPSYSDEHWGDERTKLVVQADYFSDATFNTTATWYPVDIVSGSGFLEPNTDYAVSLVISGPGYDSPFATNEQLSSRVSVSLSVSSWTDRTYNESI